MAVETLPKPTIPITTPWRGAFLTSTPVITAATVCLALVIASALLLTAILFTVGRDIDKVRLQSTELI